MMPTAEHAVAVLSDRELAVPASRFPADRLAATRPGLYSWWVDDKGHAVLERSLDEPLTSLIYAGQAGATSARSARVSTATLGSRIGNNHIRGTAHGSTFRKSISALLLEPLNLRLDRADFLVKEDNLRVTEWIQAHLSIVIYPYDDRDALGRFEDEVLRVLDPPLNLGGMSPTPVRAKLTALRREVSRPVLLPRIVDPDPGPDQIAETLETQDPKPARSDSWSRREDPTIGADYSPTPNCIGWSADRLAPWPTLGRMPAVGRSRSRRR
jgi:hypothetical protein